MKYWLLKSEPGTWSWKDQEKSKTTNWDGVRNYQARNNLIKMKKGDMCFFYHSMTEKKIIGVVRVIKESYPDPTDKSQKFVMVDVKVEKKLKIPVSLEQIKNNKNLQHLGLVRQGRLSVMPIDYKSWLIIMKLSKTKIIKKSL